MKDFFGVDDPFVRPLPPRWWRADVVIALGFLLLAVTNVWVTTSLAQGGPPWQWDVVWVAVAAVLLMGRRRWPVVSTVLLASHFILVGTFAPHIVVQVGMQVAYFVSLYSGVAWGRNRLWVMIAAVGESIAMTLWLALTVSVANAQLSGLLTTMVPYWIYTVVLNVAFFGGAIWLGRNAWQQARAEAEVIASTELIEAQARQLADQAVVGERLRIARDLHDSIAHHVALIGVQAGAARRALEKKPELAAEALGQVERSARQSIAELRSVLGSLRDTDGGEPGQPNLARLPELVAEMDKLGLEVNLQLVGDEAAFGRTSTSQEAALYRVVQEALTNVRKHSSARSAHVRIRAGAEYAEAEILDDGRPLQGTAGGGLGQIGIRERVAALGGNVEMGPRRDQGFRVLVRLPLEQE